MEIPCVPGDSVIMDYAKGAAVCVLVYKTHGYSRGCSERDALYINTVSGLEARQWSGA